MSAFSFSRFRGVAYRATSYDTPLWVFPNRREGRWSHPDDRTIAQYCTLDAAAPMAEFLRHEDLRSEKDASELRLSIWQLQMAEGAILDLSTPEKAARQGVEWEELLSDDWRPCQELGRQVAAAGGRGVLAPCAALPGTMSITAFGPRSEIAWTAEPRLAIQVPAREILRAAPGAGVVRSTRFFGDPYPADIRLTPVGHLLST
jgi:RES domain-containing protein